MLPFSDRLRVLRASHGRLAGRYVIVSLWNTLCHQVTLLVAYSGFGWSGGWSNVFAACVAAVPAYFLRPGDPTIPILYEVGRIRDGRSFTTRRVIAIQHGQAIFHLSASFHVQEDGFEHQFPPPPGLPDPETLPDFKTRNAAHAAKLGEWYERPRPIDTRYVGPDVSDRGEEPLPPYQHVWMRADGHLPDDPVLHQCVLTYASDMSLLDTVTLPHGVSVLDGTVMMASLDHAMWFHRPFRADQWFLYSQDTPSASGARGLARGLIYQGGQLVVSVVQEGLVRPLHR